MNKFKQGDEVRVRLCNIKGFIHTAWSEGNEGHTFIVGKIEKAPVVHDHAKFYYMDAGCRFDTYEEDLELVPKKPLMTRLNTMMKKLLDSDTQKLVKAGFINGDLDLTTEGRDELISMLFIANKAELVKLAEEKIAETEPCKE